MNNTLFDALEQPLPHDDTPSIFSGSWFFCASVIFTYGFFFATRAFFVDMFMSVNMFFIIVQ